ncbi:MAG: TrkA family potassium uptake protein [Candidatus Nanopelagicales bacterium]
MHIVIMGCGRVGSALALKLEEEGHSVAVIDRDAASFRRLGPTFRGTTVTGVGFDRDTLRRANIAEAHAFAAVSSGDNSNILAARVARETFAVENVVARIYDPKRAEIYERLGIPTVATVAWSTGQMLRRLMPEGASEEWRDPSGTVILAQMTVNPEWIGHRIRWMGEQTGSRIAFVTRYGEGLLPDADTVLQEGDLLHIVMRADERDSVEKALRQPPKETP